MIGSKINRDIGVYTYCPACGKRQYRTKGEAERVLMQLKRKRKGDGSVYQCGQCGCWHTTSESWERSKGRKQGITTRKIEEEIRRKKGVKPIDPYTLIRIEQAKLELQAIADEAAEEAAAKAAEAAEAAAEQEQEEQAAPAAEAQAATAAAPAEQKRIEQKPFNNITGMKIFIDSEDQQTSIFVGVEKDGDKDTLRLAVSTKDENGINGPWAGANLSYDMVAELIEALNIQKTKMKR